MEIKCRSPRMPCLQDRNLARQTIREKKEGKEGLLGVVLATIAAFCGCLIVATLRRFSHRQRHPKPTLEPVSAMLPFVVRYSSTADRSVGSVRFLCRFPLDLFSPRMLPPAASRLLETSVIPFPCENPSNPYPPACY